MLRLIIALLAASLLLTCDRSALTDLSEYAAKTPEDGIGHYVYALTAPETVAPGDKYNIAMEWRTVGPADPTASYGLDVRLKGPDTKVYNIAPSANTVGEYHLTNWLEYHLAVPQGFPPGDYTVSVRVIDGDQRSLPLGFKEELREDDGYYRITSVRVEP